MSKKRFAPLINALYSVAAIGEALGRFAVGDVLGAKDSALAASLSGLTLLSYIIETDNGINYSSALFNAGYATLLYPKAMSTYSLTLKFFPLVAMYQVGSNSLEAYLKKDKE